VTIPALTLKIPAGKYPSREKYALRKGRKNYQSLEGRKISRLRKTPQKKKKKKEIFCKFNETLSTDDS
jgi:hypothetical protein